MSSAIFRRRQHRLLPKWGNQYRIQWISDNLHRIELLVHLRESTVRQRRLVIGIVIVPAGLIGVLLTLWWQVTLSRGTVCQAPNQPLEGRLTCFTPSHLEAVKRRLHAPLVDPLPIVQRRTHLNLTELSALQIGKQGADVVKAADPTQGIFFMFGTSWARVERCGGRTSGILGGIQAILEGSMPPYVQVGETLRTEGSPSRIQPVITLNGLAGCQAWYATATIPARGLVLSVQSNLPRQEVVWIEQELLHAT
jgi:hypothetical protein